ncbi:cytochrome c maturation protein CcmE [Salmonella enterica subsp. enterica]|nr:cytochrome c maturation protein CcmE [Salmonella enterica subsp. enterica]
MGGYAFFVWLAVAITVAPLAPLALHTVLQRRAILRGVAQQQARETQQLPAVGQRLRVGGMVMPGSVRRDPDSLKVNFSLYDAEGAVTVSYEGILPDLFREGQGVVVQGTLEKGNHVLAHEVLARHDENYTPPEVEKAMQENHRRPQRADKDTSS